MQFGKRCLALLSDEAFDSLMYFLKTRKRLNLVDPQTYTEKLLYIKRNDHNPLMTLCADTVLVLADSEQGIALKPVKGNEDMFRRLFGDALAIGEK